MIPPTFLYLFNEVLYVIVSTHSESEEADIRCYQMLSGDIKCYQMVETLARFGNSVQARPSSLASVKRFLCRRKSRRRSNIAVVLYTAVQINGFTHFVACIRFIELKLIY